MTLRQVASEAGVSARLLQYYFGTRQQLLLGALEILNSDAELRAREHLAELGDDPGMRAIVRGVLLEMLPLDAERHDRHVVYAAYFVQFLVDPRLAAVAEQAGPALADLITGLLAQAQSLGEVPSDLDISAEAIFLVAGAEGLQTSVLLGQLTAERAVEILDGRLDRVFGDE